MHSAQAALFSPLSFRLYSHMVRVKCAKSLDDTLQDLCGATTRGAKHMLSSAISTKYSP